MRVDGAGEWTETAALRNILKIVRPGDAVLFHQVENGAGNGLVTAASRKREAVTGGEVAKRSGSHQERTVGKRGTQHGREIAVIHRKFLRQIVVKRNFVLVVEYHGLVVSVFFHAFVDLLALVVDEDKAIHQRLKERVIGVIEVGFAMG